MILRAYSEIPLKKISWVIDVACCTLYFSYAVELAPDRRQCGRSRQSSRLRQPAISNLQRILGCVPYKEGEQISLPTLPPPHFYFSATVLTLKLLHYPFSTASLRPCSSRSLPCNGPGGFVAQRRCVINKLTTSAISFYLQDAPSPFFKNDIHKY